MPVSSRGRTAATVLGAAGALVAGLLLVPGTASADTGATYIVGNPATCANVDYPTISDAVAVAAPGDTIKVCAGLFAEHVDISTPDLTILGAQADVNAAGRKKAKKESIVSDPGGVFTLEGSADDTTINGFTIQGARVNNAIGISAFAGSSGLQLLDNIVQANSGGIYLQNPDGSKPALISGNKFANNNAGGDPGDNPNTGTGVFICCGPANNTTISSNQFSQDSQTAVNFAGDSNNPSTGLQVVDNTSIDDSTFVVATNSTDALIEDNVVTTNSANVPGPYGHGTGILDFGANTNLRIAYNILSAVGATTASGISVSNYSGSSAYTTVIGNKITNWFNDIKVVSGNSSAFVTGNTLKNAQNDGLIAQPDTSGLQFTHNTVANAALYACEDQTSGTGTAGTANTWRGNSGNTASAPAGICRNTAA